MKTVDRLLVVYKILISKQLIDIYTDTYERRGAMNESPTILNAIYVVKTKNFGKTRCLAYTISESCSNLQSQNLVVTISSGIK